MEFTTGYTSLAYTPDRSDLLVLWYPPKDTTKAVQMKLPKFWIELLSSEMYTLSTLEGELRTCWYILLFETIHYDYIPLWLTYKKKLHKLYRLDIFIYQ